MNFRSYFVISSFIVIGVVTHAYIAYEQFYPAVTYMSTDKVTLAVMYNFAFALFLLFGKMLLKLFIGSLRDLEVEQLVDSGRGFLADTILFLVFYAPTIDNKEVGTFYLIQYICCVIFMKVFHLTTQIRVSHMFEVGVPRLIVSIKLVTLMGLLLSMDCLALQYFYSVSSRSSTFFTWILFEALTMSTVVMASLCKYSVHMVDLRLDNGWPGKSVFLFYIDLIHDVVSMTLFLVFMLTFFVQNPSRLPIYMMADILSVARKLTQRLRSFRRYRRISLNMEVRFPDATDEEIEQNEHCVICRDSLFEGSKPKKLACGHIFHIDCLRSWLVMQQSCPTCRAEIPAEVAPAATPRAMAQANQQPQPQPPQLAAAAAAVAAAAAPPAAPSAASQAPAVSSAASASSPVQAASGASSSGAGIEQSSATGSAHSPQATAQSATAQCVVCPAGACATASQLQGRGSSAPSSSPDLLPGGALMAPASAAAALPPVQEVLDALARAEEMSKFLRQQADFWMEQVQLIQQGQRNPNQQVLIQPASTSTPPAHLFATAPASPASPPEPSPEG